eukprot:CAMPEP_0172377530 /NCGR_PEP_ID=MMETSP1060-20121228/68956_1 /TAXON_ID=37318 /ORGANISM="Pseudo-nitzschia pungens, Strain cf. cingulata" /LENGTH=288 /DNA_ID=CAMNT_0013105223 /DNA_START=585 /DNA_END=1448 /DNA_ORIENTATION=-
MTELESSGNATGTGVTVAIAETNQFPQFDRDVAHILQELLDETNDQSLLCRTLIDLGCTHWDSFLKITSTTVNSLALSEQGVQNPISEAFHTRLLNFVAFKNQLKDAGHNFKDSASYTKEAFEDFVASEKSAPPVDHDTIYSNTVPTASILRAYSSVENGNQDNHASSCAGHEMELLELNIDAVKEASDSQRSEAKDMDACPIENSLEVSEDDDIESGAPENHVKDSIRSVVRADPSEDRFNRNSQQEGKTNSGDRDNAVFYVENNPHELYPEDTYSFLSLHGPFDQP